MGCESPSWKPASGTLQGVLEGVLKWLAATDSRGFLPLSAEERERVVEHIEAVLPPAHIRAGVAFITDERLGGP